MAAALRPARAEDCAALSALCLRSKAHWGYDAAFMDACRAELTLTPDDLTGGRHVIALEDGGTLAGTAQVCMDGETADLHKFFVEPAAMGRGHGRRLFGWAVRTAAAEGARLMTIEADPQAAPFYARMGARVVGEVPSQSIPGRALPLLHMDIREPADAE